MTTEDRQKRLAQAWQTWVSGSDVMVANGGTQIIAYWPIGNRIIINEPTAEAAISVAERALRLHIRASIYNNVALLAAKHGLAKQVNAILGEGGE